MTVLSSATADTDRPGHAGGDHRVTFGRVVRSEWTKLRSLRSTWIVLGVTVALTVGLAAAFGHGFGSQVRAGEVAPTVARSVDVTFIGIDLPALIMGVFGILQMTGEYGSGLIRTSLAAVPKRGPLLLAKAVVLAAVTAALMVPACLVSFVVCQALIGDQGAGLTDAGAPRAVLGAAAYPVAVALLGLGTGALLRHSAPTITVFVVVLLIVPVLLAPALPDDLEKAVLPYVPVAAAQATYALQAGGWPVPLLSPGRAALVLACWVIAVLAAGLAALSRRDA